jgi:predicted Zn-dependent protease with MMP-like domain
VTIVVDEARFESLVDDALDSVPEQLFTAMDNVVVLIADRHPDEPDLLGLYEGVALTERDTTYSGFLPDTITIYRGALCDFCATEEQLVHEVAVTVIHEIAHHFGIEEHTLHELGWG